MAKVDVLLPFWGDVDLFKKAVRSVMGQTEHDWRLFVIDDCYPSKEPAAFIKELNDKRITYHRHKKNLGITNNFNFALGKATAQHCVMFGYDDIMLPNYLEHALSKVGNCDFYQPGVDVIDATDHTYLPLSDRMKRILQPHKSGVYKGEKLATSLCHGNWLYFPSILWKTKAIKKYGFDANYKILEDVILQMNILRDGGSLYFDKTTTFQYRRFSESLSSKEKAGVRFDEEREVYTLLSEQFKDIGWHRASRAARLHITSRIHKLINSF